MKAPLSWLKEYVDIDVDIQTLCQKMVGIGFEIEGVENLSQRVSNIVVGQIVEISKHPDADKLQCCKVDVGQAELLPIVTAAKNISVNDKIPVALHNSKTANGLHITKGKIRGELSCGMFCSGEELGISDSWYEGADVDGILILKKEAKIGQSITDEIGLNDYVLDISVTSNRQDCNSIYGIAREVAAVLNKECRPLELSFSECQQPTKDFVSVVVEAKDLCTDYLMQGVVDANVEKSPTWLTQRLAKVGLHGISNFVDITNYVLMEIGQPMHAFDYADLSDKTIVVRRAKDGEKIVPLDGKTYTLNSENLVIADKTRAVGLAGIMGGQNSGIKPETSAVMFESARFSKGNIRKSSRKLGLKSDSSSRFEKGMDSYSANAGLCRALNLVEKLNCGKILSERICCVTTEPKPAIVEFKKEKIKKLLGIEISEEMILKILNNLSIVTSIDKEDTIHCEVPLFRDDIKQPCDIIEELIRFYGFDGIVGTLMPNCKITSGGYTKSQIEINKLQDVLCGLRFNQCVFYPFLGKSLLQKFESNNSNGIELLNPISDDLSIMRTSAVPHMLQCASLNHSHKNFNLRLFECGKVYLAEKLPLEALPIEENHITLCADGLSFDEFKDSVLTLVKQLNDNLQLARSNESCLHPGISADIFVENKKVASFGQVHPQVSSNFDLQKTTYIADVNVDVLMSVKTQPQKFQPIPKFPSVERDFALVADEGLDAQIVLDEFKKNCPLCESASLFDIYRGQQLGENKKSLAIAIVFRDKNKTLSDSDIQKQVAKCLKVLNEKYGIVLR